MQSEGTFEPFIGRANKAKIYLPRISGKYLIAL